MTNANKNKLAYLAKILGIIVAFCVIFGFVITQLGGYYFVTKAEAKASDQRIDKLEVIVEKVGDDVRYVRDRIDRALDRHDKEPERK